MNFARRVFNISAPKSLKVDPDWLTGSENMEWRVEPPIPKAAFPVGARNRRGRRGVTSWSAIIKL